MPDNAQLIAGRYRLESVLGRGGMGQVWQARDEMLGRQVAVKEVRFPTGLADEEREVLCQRTMREARLTARVSHPGIVTIYDVVSENDRPYIVMELVNAPSLAQEIDAHGPLSPARTASMGLGLLAALDVAHLEGVVHRDVKPSNVLLSDDRVVLTDFGIATSDSDATLTSTGLLVGSPTYMSPERLRGEAIGPPADLWSLGATLYAALEAEPPFRGPTVMGTITSVLADDPPVPGVVGPLRDALLGLLTKSPERRLTSAQVRPLLRQVVERPAEAVPSPAAAAPTTTVHLPAVPPVMAPAALEPAGGDFFSWVSTDEEPKPLADPASGSEPPRGPSSAPERSGRRPGTRSLLAALAIAVLAIAAVIVSQLGGSPSPTGSPGTSLTSGDSGTHVPSSDPSGVAGPRGSTTTTAPSTKPRKSPSSSPSKSPSTSPSSSASTTTPPSASPSSTPGSVPAGYRLLHDPLNFTVAVPRGWNRRYDGGTSVDFVSPDGSSYLRVDQIAQAGPSAEQAWLDNEPSVAARLPGYHRIRIDPIDFRGWSAADWEFTWQGSSGTIHVLNRGIITDPRGFALYMSGPDATWQSQSLPVFDQAAATFEPSG